MLVLDALAVIAGETFSKHIKKISHKKRGRDSLSLAVYVGV